MPPVKEFSFEHLYFGMPPVSTGEDSGIYIFAYYGFPLVKTVLGSFQGGISPVKEFGNTFVPWYTASFN